MRPRASLFDTLSNIPGMPATIQNIKSPHQCLSTIQSLRYESYLQNYYRVIYNLTIYGEWLKKQDSDIFFHKANKTKQHFGRLLSESPPLLYFSSSSK